MLPSAAASIASGVRCLVAPSGSLLALASSWSPLAGSQALEGPRFQRPVAGSSASAQAASEACGRGHARGLSHSTAEPRPKVDFDQLGFGLKDVAESMYISRWTPERGWAPGQLEPYGPLPMLPSAQVLNYGQSIFEGMKAQHSARGRTVIFRPSLNAERFAAGAERLCMPPVPEQQFVEAVKSVIRSNADWVPPMGKGSLYVRPLLMGSGPILGLGPAPEFTFAVFAAAVGAYFKGSQLTPIDLLVEEPCPL